MPEWSFDLKVTFWAPSEERAQGMAEEYGTAIFNYDHTLTVEAPYGPTWLKDDDDD